MKAYLAGQAERYRTFFRKGNLIALRELALRRMAIELIHKLKSSR